MKTNIKTKIIYISAWISLLGFLSFSMGFVAKSKKNTRCLEIVVEINDSGNFIDEDKVKSILKTNNIYLPGVLTDSINLNKAEKAIKKHNQVKKVETYITVDGRLIVNITQRRPLIRIFNEKRESFYIDEDGYLMKTSNTYSPHILVANGRIKGGFKDISSCMDINLDSASYKQKQLRNLFDLARRINSDSFYYRLQIKYT